MKKLTKTIAVFLAFAVFASGIIMKPVNVEASSKNATYCITFGQASTFKKSNGKLTIKAPKGQIWTAKSSTGIKNKKTSKTKLSYKIAKNCK
ncbi:MAG: hypothetical protein Q4B70_19420 [Lachnospiraceae bacterium]|nr:hypothetical protein [Lachnospiraceae bacterium]